MYKLHYTRLDLGVKETNFFVFKKQSKMTDFIDEQCIDRRGRVVWLIAQEGSSDVFVSESYLSILDFLKKKYCWDTKGDYFLQEYARFDDAYKVALSIAKSNARFHR